MSVQFSYYKPKDNLPYALYIPQGKAPKGGWPLIVFLHGSGERGKDGKKQAAVGLGPAIQANPENWPAVVLMPQCPLKLQWRGKPLEQVFELLAGVEAAYKTNKKQVYLTGLSMGGYGSWNLACMHPERFAAVAPICGTGDPFAVWFALGQVPIWNFHGTADDVVPVSFSRVLADALHKAGSTQALFTEYVGEKHDVWNRVYQDQPFIDWLFSQKQRG